MTQGKFINRFTQHKHSYKTKSKRNATTISTYAWDKEINTRTEKNGISLKKLSVYQPGNFYCDLCLCEKIKIIKNARSFMGLKIH